MKKCKYTQDGTLDKYVLNQMNESAENEMIEHLQECEPCSARLGEIRKLAANLNEKQADAVRKTLRPRMIGMVAASVAVIASVVGYALLHENTPIAPDVVTAIVDTASINEPVESIEEVAPEEQPERTVVKRTDNQTYKQQQQLKRRQAPSLASSENYDNTQFRVIAPHRKKVTYFLRNNCQNNFEFKWHNPSESAVTVELRNNETILLSKEVEAGDSFSVDLGKYAEYTEIDWVVRLDEGEVQYSGKLNLEKFGQ